MRERQSFWTWLKIGSLIVFVWFLLSPVVRHQDGLNMQSFSTVPVLHNGRLKPLDSVARQALLLWYGKQSFRSDGISLSAMDIFIMLTSDPKKADALALFLIHDPNIKSHLGYHDLKQKYFSFNTLVKHIQEIQVQAEKAQKVETPLRTRYQTESIRLYQQLILYHQLKNAFYVEGSSSFSDQLATLTAYKKAGDIILEKGIPKSKMTVNEQATMTAIEARLQDYTYSDYMSPIKILPDFEAKKGEWHSMGEGLSDYFFTSYQHPLLLPYAELFDSVQNRDYARGNAVLNNMLSLHKQIDKWGMIRCRSEVWFNHIQPFYKSAVLYIITLLCVMVSWLKYGHRVNDFARLFMIMAFSTHTAGLLARMILQGRPPVTNLYSSAVFVGWAAVGLGMCLINRQRMVVGVSAILGFLSLIIAHHLSLSGDTMEMMQAVLDSNFWLSTHVVTITLGYSAAFFAGFLGIVSVAFRFVAPQSYQDLQKDWVSMIYGLVCFCLFFSFVGTVLGGIWADQSWGRFWGWDPKENGALMIVIWMAILLHARLAGIIGKRGLVYGAIIGNAITSFSWFGVNMLGVGLHSYGFMNKAFWWLIAFVSSQVLIILISLFREKYVSSRVTNSKKIAS